MKPPERVSNGGPASPTLRASRVTAGATLALLASLALSCANDPVKLYEGPVLDASRIAILVRTGDATTRVFAVDDIPVSGTTFHLAPGLRSIWTKTRMHANAGSRGWVIWTHCRFEVDVKAGHVYELRSITRITESTTEGKRGQIGASIVEAGSEVAYPPRLCMGDRPQL